MDTKQLSGPTQPKSFWKRPEGVTGTVVLAGLLVGGGIALYKALPYLITLASNLLYLSGMLLVLGAVIYMVLDPRMRTLVGYMYKSLMRWVTGIFIQMNPIGILKNYVEDLKNSLAKANEQIGILMGQRQKVQTLSDESKKEVEASLRLAKVAQQQGKQDQFTLATRKAARHEEAGKKYQELLGKMDILKKVLYKMAENAQLYIVDTEDQIKLKEVEYKAIKASHSAMQNAVNIINGNGDGRQMFDMSMDYILDDMANKVGEMEHFMESTRGMMDAIDLNQGVMAESGMQMLAAYEEKLALPAGNLLQSKVPVRETVELEQGNQYDKLFKS